MFNANLTNNRLSVNPFIHMIAEQNKYLLFDASIPRFYFASPSSHDILNYIKAEGNNVSFEQVQEAMISVICNGDLEITRQIEKMIKYGVICINNEKIYKDSPIMGEIKVPKIDTMFLIVSDHCNFLCDYCHVMHNKLESVNRDMTLEQLYDYLAYFEKISNHDTKRNVVFFGGEPLLNFSVVEKTIDFWSSDANIEYTLFTNCSLVTEAIAKKLAAAKVKVIASIDGIDEHDHARKDLSGFSTYGRTLEGYEILRKNGCTVGISCTVGKHNVGSLASLCSKIIAELSPANIGFNILHDMMAGKGQTDEEIKEVNRQMVEAYKICAQEGLYFVQAINRLRPIIDEHPRVQDCGAYGRQIVVTPSGKIGTCEVLSTSDVRFMEFKNDMDLTNDAEFKLWANRFPINFPECENCRAIALCGGGCAYDSILHYGDINHKDIRCCEQAFSFFDYAKEFILNMIYVETDEIIPVPRQDLRRLYGNIDVDSELYPLTTYHKRLNIGT